MFDEIVADFFCTKEELAGLHDHLNRLERKIMSALTDLQDAETANAAQVQAVVTDIDTLVAQLAATPPDDTATIQAVTAQIQASTAALAAAATKASPPATPPATPASPPDATAPVDPNNPTPTAP